MKKIPIDLYRKIEQVSKDVKQDLLKKGVVIPVKNEDGSVKVGKFVIVKNSNGFFEIKNINGDVVVDKINLPQTAAVIANSLALGRFRDERLLQADKYYGFAVFDEMVHRRAEERSKSLDQYELMTTKRLLASAKKEFYKTSVVKSFQKLVNIV